MKIALTIPQHGAGTFAWNGWANAIMALDSTSSIVNLGSNPRLGIHNAGKVDLLICSTSCPSQELVEWRKNNPDAKVALNVLAWTDVDWVGVKNPGVQASEGNINYARQLKPNLVFAQYSPRYSQHLLSHWRDKEGYKIGSMEMAADSTVYKPKENDFPNIFVEKHAKIVYTGGYWPYKAQNINKYLLPLIQKYRAVTWLIGKGWPIHTDPDIGEALIGQYFHDSLLCPNVHEPHSTTGGFDVVERVFKTMYCGGLCLSDNVAELEKGFGLYNKEHLLIASNSKDYLEIADDVLKNPGDYDEIKRKGQKEVAEKHTYVHRVKKLLQDLEIS